MQLQAVVATLGPELPGHVHAATAGAVLLGLGEERAASAAGAADLTTFSSDRSEASNFRIAGGALLGGGGLAGCISLIHFAILSASPPAKKPAERPVVRAAISPQGGFVGLELAL